MRRRTILQLAASTLLAAAGPKRALVKLQTEFGNVLIEADLLRAPLSAAAFLAIVDDGGWDGGDFIQAVHPEADISSKSSVLQALAPDPAFLPKVGLETTQATGLRHLDGTVSLVGQEASGGQFYICIGDQPDFDFGGAGTSDGRGEAVFGHVAEGMEIVRRIWGMETTGPRRNDYDIGWMLRKPVSFRVQRIE